MTTPDRSTAPTREPDLLAAVRDLRDAEALARIVPPGPAFAVAHDRLARARAAYAAARTAAGLRS